VAFGFVARMKRASLSESALAVGVRLRFELGLFDSPYVFDLVINSIIDELDGGVSHSFLIRWALGMLR
jgi:hypothetical protein